MAEERARFVNYKDISVFLVDLSGIKDMEQSKFILRGAAKIIKEQPKGSVFLMTDVTDANYNMDAIEALKAFSTSITPHVKASCVVGVSGIKKMLMSTISKLSGRDIHSADTRDGALEFLYQRSKGIAPEKPAD